MTWKHRVAFHAIVPRRRVIATSLVYGLSLAVRYTSATGEEVEIPPRYLQATDPALAVVTNDGTRLPYRNRSLYAAEPIIFRRGEPLSSGGCGMACDFPLRGLSRPSCLSR